MRLHRFYSTTPIQGKTFDVTDRDLVHQWKTVFRYNVGSQVVLFDGSGIDYLCIISSLRGLGATLSVIRETKKDSLTPRKNIWLCMALVKKDNFELIAQKVTELGVTNIVPILCEHSEKKKINLGRLKKIAVEATEQSGRAEVPVIHPEVTLENLFNSGVLPEEKIVLHPEGMIFDKYKSSSSHPSIAVFVGPEGGFSPKELAMFKSYNVQIVSLGSQILRAETAAIAISSLLLI
ncbi:MAG TPA: RsmE family RNA methyltransferase [Candidatus Paceibacterota bacterium]